MYVEVPRPASLFALYLFIAKWFMFWWSLAWLMGVLG